MSADHHDFRLRASIAAQDERCNLQSGLGMPCPFCGAVGFTKYPVFEAETHPPQTCEECARTAFFSFEDIEYNGMPARKYQVLQTGGPPSPDWFQPRIGWVQ